MGRGVKGQTSIGSIYGLKPHRKNIYKFVRIYKIHYLIRCQTIILPNPMQYLWDRQLQYTTKKLLPHSGEKKSPWERGHSRERATPAQLKPLGYGKWQEATP